MRYTPSVNIVQTQFNEQSYIITQNARCVVGNIINSFNSGIHSLNVIGSYGTGKSNFILALEHSLKNPNYKLIDNIGQFNNLKKFEFLKIVGDYASIIDVIPRYLPSKYRSNNFIENLLNYYNEITEKGSFLFIAIDEFGKILEHAAKNNPEKELYTLQQFAEFVNDENKNIILLTTLHQNFSSYAKGLSDSQRNEWIKVKGRFGEIVFNEPVEQLLHLAAARLDKRSKKMLNSRFKKLFDIAKESKFISATFDYNIAEKLYPMDMFAAQALTLSIQRYGQNERTLFSFLEAQGTGSLKEFDEHPIKTYSLANVYDYVTYTFYSYLSEVNLDSSSWSAMRVALEKVEGLLDIELISVASKIIKSIGLLNLFGTASVRISKEIFETYSRSALGIENPKNIIALLERHQIIRFAVYKSQYVIFEGTDVNIENELLQAAVRVPRSRDVVSKLNSNFSLPVEFANSVYYKKGTPRYFQYIISEQAKVIVPYNEIDGYINLVFSSDPLSVSIDKIKEDSSKCEEAVLFAYFKNTNSIKEHLWEIDKLEYVQLNIDDKDFVAHKELKSLLSYEKEQLNNCVLNTLYSFTEDVIWIYKGDEIIIKNKTDFNKKLSSICEEVYSQTPIFINEMVNKHKPSGAMSLARVKYFEKLLDNSGVKDLGFEIEKFPPEKTIFKTLLQNTGIHRNEFGVYDLQVPNDASFLPLWDVCERFLLSTSDKPKKIAELSKILKNRPFKIKQGFIDLWLPTYLIIKKNDYSLYDSNNIYIPSLNREVLDILQKSPNDFSIKAFNVEGVKLDLFNQYRKFVGAAGDADFTTDSLIETIRPFLVFYNKLDKYAKHTKKLNKGSSIKFRDVLARAKDPEKTFFEDLPKALGFSESKLSKDEEVLKRYVELIQSAIRDLRSCYIGLIERLEKAIVEAINLNSSEFIEYQKELVSHYSSIKMHLLTNKQKTFLNRVITTTNNRKSWYESICYVVLDKKLEDILDEEEEYLVDNLIFSFKDLFKYVDISKLELNNNENFFRVELISKDGENHPKVVKLTTEKETKALQLEHKINDLLSGESDIDMYAILSILNKKMKNE